MTDVYVVKRGADTLLTTTEFADVAKEVVAQGADLRLIGVTPTEWHGTNPDGRVILTVTKYVDMEADTWVD